MPVTPHLVSGKVYDLYSIALVGATVTLTHSTITPSISKTTNAAGEYVINLNKLNTQWSSGDSITITASKTAEGTKTTETTISGAGGQTVNLTLAETSDLNYATNIFNKHNLNFVLLTHYDGGKVTRERPLPVLISNIDLLNNPEQTNTYDSKNRLSTETVIIRGVSYKRTFTYTGNSFQFTTRGKWIRQ